MSRTSRVVLGLLVAVSFTLSATVLAAAGHWLRTPAGTRAVAIARASARAALPGAVPFTACALAPTVCVATQGFTTLEDDGDGLGYALVDPGEDGRQVIEMNGHHPDFDELTRNDPRPLLWFVRGGEEWVSRDADMVGRARNILEPILRIGHQMGEVGREMGRHGAEIGRWGGEMGRIGGRLGRLETQRALEARNDDERERLEAEIARTRAEMRQVSARMREERRDGDTGALRARMRDLSQQHREALREARAKMRQLVDEAVRTRRAAKLGVGA